MSWGASWGDFDGDTLPDLWTSNHFSRPTVYRNRGEGTFADITPQVTIPKDLIQDTHAAAWGDFDNDGDSDLSQLVGAQTGRGDGPSQLFVNDEGRLEDRGKVLGIDYPLGRGRTPLWFDENNDGQLDLIFAAKERPDGQAPPTIFRQNEQRFDNVGSTIGFDPSAKKSIKPTPHAFLSDLDGNRALDLIYAGSPPYSLSHFISPKLLPIIPDDLKPNEDIAAADFNGDLRTDLYLIRTVLGNSPDLPDRLLLNTTSGFVDRTTSAGLNATHFDGNSASAGDFDNDMDVDLYVNVVKGSDANQPNILLENQGDGTFIPLLDAGGASGTTRGLGDTVALADYDLDGFLDLFVTNGKTRLPPNNCRQGDCGNGPYQLFHNRGNGNHWLEIDLEGISSNRDGIGASVIATSGGVKQLREQSGGIHNRAQNHQRLHFGLADNTQVEELKIYWPSGITQTLKDIPADQLIRIVEPTRPVTSGKPDGPSKEGAKVLLWQDTVDGPFHLRTIGAGDATQFAVNAIASDTVSGIDPISLEAKDGLKTTDFGFSLNSNVVRQQDGVDFRLAPGAKVLLSVTQEGVPNPRQLQVGGKGSGLAPAGWIVGAEDFPQRPSFQAGEDLSLFVGKGAKSDRLEFRWNGDGKLHNTDLSVLASQGKADFSPVGLDRRDTLSTFENGVEIDGRIGSDADGLDVTVPEKTQVGFTYKQDGLFQSHRVNPFDGLLGLPNAYELPVADPYGQPDFDASEDAGLFLWKDEKSGVWEMQATAGGEEASYKGSIVADRAAASGQAVQAEGDDSVDTSNSSHIDFNLNVTGSDLDGIRFRFPDAAELSLELEGGAGPLRLGSEQWTVNKVPVDLSGWA